MHNNFAQKNSHLYFKVYFLIRTLTRILTMKENLNQYSILFAYDAMKIVDFRLKIMAKKINNLNCLLHIFTFFYIHKKKVLDSRKFSTSGFRWIYMSWDVLNTIWPFLENVCLSVCLSVGLSVLFCGRCISRTNGRKLMKLNIQLHLYGT